MERQFVKNIKTYNINECGSIIFVLRSPGEAKESGRLVDG